MAFQNWSRNVMFGCDRVARPRTRDEIVDIVATHPKVGVVGAGHSFNTIADTDGVLLDLGDMNAVLEVDRSAETITVEGGIRYHELCDALHAAGGALHNLMSIPHFSVAGACATGTHGSGDTNPALASAIREIELVTGKGDVVRLQRGDAEFGAAVVGIGALGVVTELVLDTEPSFDMAQELHLELSTETAIDHFDEIMASAYSVSLFTDWQGDTVNQLWRKHRVDAATAPNLTTAYMGARPAATHLTPVGEPGAGVMTPQLLQRGPWHQRLTHVDPSFALAPAGELQSEYFVSRSHTHEALQAVADAAELLAPVIRMAEVRTVAADSGAPGDRPWLSPFAVDALALHFSWLIGAEDELDRVLPLLEDVLAPFDPLPHWGKLHTMDSATIRAGYPRFGDFVELAERWDPDRRFRNPTLDALLRP